HPHGGNEGVRRRVLLQRRRLGRRVYRTGRALRRAYGDSELARGNRPSRCARRAGGFGRGNGPRRLMRIAIVTDAWTPQVNGVVRTLVAVTDELRGRGHQVLVVSPDQFRSLPCPTYPEIRLALVRA